MKWEWLTWANAKKFYTAAIGALAWYVANAADAPSWLVKALPALTAVAVWLVPKNEPSTTGS